MYSFLVPILIALTLGYLATVIARLTGTVYIPYLLLLGIIFGPILYLINPNEAALLFYDYIGPIGAAFIILAESSKIPRYLLRKVIKPLFLLLTFVLFATGIVVGLLLVLMIRAPLWVGFLVGAIISSTDPASIIHSLKKLKVSDIPSTVLITESVFNDPFSYLFLIVVILIFFPENIGYVQSSIIHFSNIYVYIGMTQFFFPVVISVALFGLLFILRKYLPRDFKEYYTAIFLLFGLSSYSIATLSGGSGYMAVAIFGVLSGNFIPKDVEFENYKQFLDDVSSFVVIFIFVFLGASIDLQFLEMYLIPGIIIALALIFVVRPLSVLLAGSIDRSVKYNDLLFIGLEGIRGVFPAILAPTVLIMGIGSGNLLLTYWGKAIEAIVLVIIFTSLTVQPLMMGRLLKALEDPKEKEI
jgi:cell volume regulation protein A